MINLNSERGDLMRVREVAQAIRLSRARTYALIRKGEIPFVRIGGAIRVPRGAWEKWLDGQNADALAVLVSEESK